MRRTAPVAVLDSGVGGVGVLREIKNILPHEDLLYFGDSANAPYGEKSTEEVRALVHAHAARLFARAKALVLACNTATAAAAATLRAQYPNLPIIGMEPAVRPALRVKPHPRILILATAATLREQKLRELLSHHASEAHFYKCPAPGLVRLVETGMADSPEADRYLAALLRPHVARFTPDAVVLGCTHFPFASKALTRFFGTNVPLFDGAKGTAAELCRRLAASDLLHPRRTHGTVTLTSSDPQQLSLYRRLLAP
ncbi:MAG: glutamate racemase [Clostridia bacterium]|nr:glutamate racemase [Clostridia bacterium]